MSTFVLLDDAVIKIMPF